MRILIADDNRLISLGLAHLLNSLGHTIVASVKDGLEAVEMTEKYKPDVDILDIKMPRMDGIEAAGIIMKECPTPIVILSAYSDEALIEGASRVGIFAYLFKPVTEGALKPALKLAVDRFRSHQEQTQKILDLESRLMTSGMLERAKGIIIDRLRCSEEEAVRILQRVGHTYNIDLTRTAELISSNMDFLPGDELRKFGNMARAQCS